MKGGGALYSNQLSQQSRTACVLPKCATSRERARAPAVAARTRVSCAAVVGAKVCRRKVRAAWVTGAACSIGVVKWGHAAAGQSERHAGWNNPRRNDTGGYRQRPQRAWCAARRAAGKASQPLAAAQRAAGAAGKVAGEFQVL